jgi:hypothetical protein
MVWFLAGPLTWHQDKIDEGPRGRFEGTQGFNRSRAQLFSEPLLSTRRRMRRRGRSRVLTSIRTAARNFDLLLAIAIPST